MESLVKSNFDVYVLLRSTLYSTSRMPQMSPMQFMGNSAFLPSRPGSFV